MHQSNSLGSGEFPDSISSTPSPRQTGFQATVDSSLDADIVPDDVIGEIAEQFRLREILEETCAATGATGAAIALARGEKLLCRATAGSDAPDLGVSIDPNSGLSGSCIQTRRLQHCTDTEIDPLVDPEACRQLGVRSIAVLPLMRGDELLGIFEILSSQPNAFGREELDQMQTLSGRILQHNWRKEGTSKLPAESLRSSPNSKAPDTRNKIHIPISQPKIPHRTQVSNHRDIRTLVLGSLVIIAAILLGLLVGLRIGWERATLQIRNRTLPREASAPRTVKPDDMPLPAVGPPPGSRPATSPDHAAGQATQKISGATRNSSDPRGGGLTIRQGGKVVFVSPPATPTQAKDPQSTDRSRSLPDAAPEESK